MAGEIIFYDIPTKGSHPRCWSLNPWKARAALNYKGIPYKTEWTEYPDIAPKLKELGLPPNEKDPKIQYSCPAAKFPDGTLVMDSRLICERLDEIQPEPSLHMDQRELIDRTMTALGNVFGPLRPMALPRVPTMLLSEKSAKYFFETRKEWFGMGLPDLAVSDDAMHAIKNARPHLIELKSLLTENTDGPFIMGREVSFADFVIAGAFSFLKDLDRQGDLFDTIVGYDPSFSELWKSCQPWFERAD